MARQKFNKATVNYVLQGLALVIVAMITLEGTSLVQYFFSRDMMQEEATLRAQSRINTTNIQITNVMDQVETALDNNIWSVHTIMAKPDSLWSLTQRIVRNNDFIYGSAIAFVENYFPERGYWFSPYSFRNGTQIDSVQLGNEEYDYLKKEWFVKPLESGEEYWSEPYFDTGGGENTVYVYDPVTLLPTTQACLDKEGNPLKISRPINLVEKDFTINAGDNLTGWRQGCRNLKWHVTRTDYANGRNQSNDIPLLRYADVMLMKAEALTRQGSSAEAKDLVNQIRAYANAELLDHNPSLEEIYEERGREFFDENMRRTDMIRFGHYEDEYFPHYKDFPTANFDKTRRVFPVNKSMLDLNPKWKQNNGY